MAADSVREGVVFFFSTYESFSSRDNRPGQKCSAQRSAQQSGVRLKSFTCGSQLLLHTTPGHKLVCTPQAARCDFICIRLLRGHRKTQQNDKESTRSSLSESLSGNTGCRRTVYVDVSQQGWISSCEDTREPTASAVILNSRIKCQTKTLYFNNSR